MELEDDLKKSAIEHIQETSINYLIGLIVLPVCVYFSYTTTEANLHQVAWVTAHWVTAGIVLFLTNRSVRESDWFAVHQAFLDSILLTAFLVCGVLWGTSFFIFDSPNSKVDTPYLFVICIAFISAIIIPGVLWKSLFVSIALPILSAAFVKLAMEPHREYIWLTFAITLYVFVLVDGIKKQKKLVIFSVEMQRRNQKLIQDLEQQKEIAIIANENKSRFLAAASHDLRQPLHAIGLFCETLLNRKTDSGAQKLVKCIKEAATSSNSYLSALLDISKLEAGIFKPHLQSVDMASLLRRMSVEFSMQAEIKGLECATEINECWVKSDPIFLEIILRNLISNAIRYTDHGHILLRCFPAAEQTHVSVIDSGVGIPPEHHRDIFREFWQIGNPERDSNKGIGLGLSTVDRLCKYLSIDLTVVSEVGAGSNFTLKIARSSPANKVISEKSQQLTGSRSDRKIWVFENHKDSRVATAQLLTSWGYEVYAPETLDRATVRHLSQDISADIVLADFGLASDLNGIEALELLSKAAPRPIVGIILTGESSPYGIDRLRQSDFRVLFKPVLAVKLRSALMSASVELDKIRSSAVV